MGYFDDTCFSCSPLPRPFVVPGVNRTLTVLNEAALLGFEPGELQVGDDVIIILPTSQTNAYGVAKFVNPNASGWAQFAVTMNPADFETQLTAFTKLLPSLPPGGGGWWSNGGSPTLS